jgi:thymidylate kinase
MSITERFQSVRTTGTRDSASAGGTAHERSFVAGVFQALDQAGVRYCILRGYELDAVASDGLEVDILMAPEHLLRATSLLTHLHFAVLPSWGQAPHHFFVAYDERNGQWVKLDVVTDLQYGHPIRSLRAGLAERCLENRLRRSLVPVPAPEDEFLTLLLHCLLDKKTFSPAHRARLIALHALLANNASSRRRASHLLERLGGSAISWPKLSAALNACDWKAMLGWRLELRFRLWRCDPLGATWRIVSGRTLRFLRPLLFALRRPGIAVALLAPDGAGKTTLAASLAADPQLRAIRIYAGGNIEAATIGLPWTPWLHARAESSNGNGNGNHNRHQNGRDRSHSRVVFRSLRIFNRLVEKWYRIGAAVLYRRKGRLVVFDRYVYDSWLRSKETTAGKRLLRWLMESGWPEPDLVFVLDAPGEVLHQRKKAHSPEWLEGRRRGYLNLAKRIPGAIVLDATLQEEEIRRNLTARIWEYYGLRPGKNQSNGHNR